MPSRDVAVLVRTKCGLATGRRRSVRGAREHGRFAETLCDVMISAKTAASVLTVAGVALVLMWTQVTFAPGATQWICLAVALAPIVTGLLLRVSVSRQPWRS
jgi:hypothetical protein